MSEEKERMMTKELFRHFCIAGNHYMTEKAFDDLFDVVECNCGVPECQGWRLKRKPKVIIIDDALLKINSAQEDDGEID